MKINRQFILYSTIAGLFSSAMVLRVGVGIQLFYFLILFNLFLMLLMKRLWIPPGLLLLVGFIFFSGAIGIVRGTDTPTRFLKEFTGIVISALYFCCFFNLVDFDLKTCFRLYARLAYWVSLLGLFLFPIHWFFFNAPRLHSIFTEPAAFTSVCLPALYYFADQWQRKRLGGKELCVMSLAFILSQSSTGFIGVLFGMCVFSMRYRRGRILLPAVVAFLGIVLYVASSDFAMRLDDSLFSLRENDVTGTNLSTYALFSNLFVMENVVAEHPLLGNGLGSHGLSYEKYIGVLPGGDMFSDNGFEGLNAEDASSLTIRVLSDMGGIGLLLIFWFIWRYRPRGDSDLPSMSKAIIIYFFVMLLRGGVYFGDEEFFFIVFYALNGVMAKSRKVGKLDIFERWPGQELGHNPQLSQLSTGENCLY